MKHFIKTSLVSFSLPFLVACSSKATLMPTNNSSLNSISPSHKTKKDGIMQESLDTFIKEEWTPTVSKDENIRKKYMKIDTTNKLQEGKIKEVKYVDREDDGFTLQELVDKAEAYNSAKPADHNNSNVTKLNKMPVIGKDD